MSWMNDTALWEVNCSFWTYKDVFNSLLWFSRHNYGGLKFIDKHCKNKRKTKVKAKTKTKMKTKTKTKMKTKTKTKTKMKAKTKVKNKMKAETQINVKVNFCFCFHFVFWFLFLFLISRSVCIFVNSRWPRGAIDGQLSLHWPRSAIAFLLTPRGLEVL